MTQFLRHWRNSWRISFSSNLTINRKKSTGFYVRIACFTQIQYFQFLCSKFSTCRYMPQQKRSQQKANHTFCYDFTTLLKTIFAIWKLLMDVRCALCAVQSIQNRLQVSYYSSLFNYSFHLKWKLFSVFFPSFLWLWIPKYKH